MNRFIAKYKKCLIVLFVSCYITTCFSQQKIHIDSLLVDKFYSANHQKLFWFSSSKNIKRASDWLTLFDESENLGLISNQFQPDTIRIALFSSNIIDSAFKKKIDKQITGMVLFFIKYLQQGNISFGYDEISIERDSVYLYQLLNSRRRERIPSIVKRLDCKDHDYLVLKKYLHDSINITDTFKYKTVLLAMNYRRYFTVNHQSEYIVVNIPTTEAEYYINDTLALKMRTVVGRKDKQTPVFASYITNIITFPHWTVPHEIGVNEILPKVQKNANYLEQNSFDVIDSKGNEINESELNWSDYNSKNFPYTFRQSTGENNALGVLKFELQNPFSIFLHATNSNVAFTKDYRFLSHGCIRLEKPFELTDALLKGKINIAELKNGKNNIASNSIKLPHKIPAFIIYLPLIIVGKNVIFLKDVYGLIK